MNYSVVLVLLATVVLWPTTLVHAQVRDDNPIPEVPKRLKPNEAIIADTLPRAVPSVVDSLPGGLRPDIYPYSAYQDSVYFRALRLHINPSLRFALDATLAMNNLDLLRKKLQESPWQVAMRNMAVSDDVLKPDPREQVNRQLNISKAMDGGLYRPNSTGGLSATFDQIGSFLGLTEDVSPKLRYEVRQTAAVTVVVYSTAATVVANILRKVQQPGVYTATWNLRDDKMREMPDGDYVLEARVGDGIFFRKRVVIGSK